MVGTNNHSDPKYAQEAVVIKQPEQMIPHIYWKPQVCQCLHCSKKAGLLYTRGSSVSKSSYVYVIQCGGDLYRIYTTVGRWPKVYSIETDSDLYNQLVPWPLSFSKHTHTEHLHCQPGSLANCILRLLTACLYLFTVKLI